MNPRNARVGWLDYAGLGMGLAGCMGIRVWAQEPAPASPPAPIAAPAAAPAPTPADAAAVVDRDEGAVRALKAAAANRGDPKDFADPMTAATAFLAALKQKDLKKIAQATALRAATDSKSQKLFQLILAQELAQEDLDELSEKLSGLRITGSNVPKIAGTIGVVVTRPEGNRVMRRTLTMRHEKAGWKVQDISGEGALAKPIIMPRINRGGGRR